MTSKILAKPNFFKKWINSIIDKFLAPIQEQLTTMQVTFDELAEKQSTQYIELSNAVELIRQEFTNKYEAITSDNTELTALLAEANQRIQVLFNKCNNTNTQLNTLQSIVENLLEDYQKTKDDVERRLFQVEENVRANNRKWDDRKDYLELKALFSKYEDSLKRNYDEIESLRVFIAKDHPLVKNKTSDNVQESSINNLSTNCQNDYMLIDYFDFENHFRGSRTDIIKRQEFYLPYFEEKKNVLDLGCGRGEFLELLTRENIPVTGVDNYPEFVKYCQSRNLSVIYGDALEILQQSHDIDGIFAGQFIEHLSYPQIQHLCKLAFEKLTNDGCLILETPNPMSLAIFTHAFYMDPSHTKPIHPLTLQYLLQKSGFKDIQILFLTNSKLPIQIPKLIIADNDSVDKFNLTMETVSDLLFGSQDYAIIARK